MYATLNEHVCQMQATMKHVECKLWWNMSNPSYDGTSRMQATIDHVECKLWDIKFSAHDALTYCAGPLGFVYAPNFFFYIAIFLKWTSCFILIWNRHGHECSRIWKLSGNFIKKCRDFLGRDILGTTFFRAESSLIQSSCRSLRERVRDFMITFTLYVKKIFISWVC